MKLDMYARFRMLNDSRKIIYINLIMRCVISLAVIFSALYIAVNAYSYTKKINHLNHDIAGNRSDIVIERNESNLNKWWISQTHEQSLIGDIAIKIVSNRSSQVLADRSITPAADAPVYCKYSLLDFKLRFPVLIDTLKKITSLPSGFYVSSLEIKKDNNYILLNLLIGDCNVG